MLPFADNGVNPDQDSVLFLQGEGTYVSQAISELQVGTTYTVSFAANGRGGNAPRLKVSVDGQTVLDQEIIPVGGSAPYHELTAVFQATGPESVLKFEQTAAGDNTVLLDNVAVRAGGSVQEKVRLEIEAAGGVARVSWPVSAVGFVLQSTGDLGAAWVDVMTPSTVGGDRLVVSVPIGLSPQFFRLRK